MVNEAMNHELRQIVADLFETDVEAVNADFVLSTRRMQGSLARSKLDAAIRHRLGIKSRSVYSVKSYGELQSALFGSNGQDSETNASPAGITNGTHLDASKMSSKTTLEFGSSLSCGIDIEMVESFPEVEDYWKDSFYTNAFSSVEIAYCLLQEHPRMHFAARWCAKEALKKCDRVYLNEDMKNIELVSNSDSPPRFRVYRSGHPEVIQVAVSISHTPHLAVAMVCKTAGA